MSAVFSSDHVYRYELIREILDPALGCNEEPGGTMTIIGLNPSTADGERDDPTIRRCIRFTRDLGFSRLLMVNLFAYRATDPRALYAAAAAGIDIVGPQHDVILSRAFQDSERIIAAWGTPAPVTKKRISEFAETFRGIELWALGLTAGGAPRHPLYLRADAIPVPYELPGR